MPRIKYKIIGPPGTGKTTYLLELISNAAKVYDPGRIGAMSFTKAAVQEMAGRIIKSSNCSKDTLRNVKTLHSICFKLLEMKKENVADSRDNIQRFNDSHPEYRLPLTGLSVNEDDNFDYSGKEMRKIFLEMQYNRNIMLPKNLYKDFTIDFENQWLSYMNMMGCVDYTGMLERVLELRLKPEVDCIYVDECQDLTPLQLKVILMWAEDIDALVMAGDEDQSIFRWAGAVSDVFMRQTDFTGEILLDQSYRVSREVHGLAMEMIRKIRRRTDYAYMPLDINGEVFKTSQPDLSLPGEHMILCRTKAMCHYWIRWLIERGVAYKNLYREGDLIWNVTENKLFKAARTFINLKGGLAASGNDIVQMVNNMIAKDNIIHGKKEIIAGLVDSKHYYYDKDLKDIGAFTDRFLGLGADGFLDCFKLTGNAGALLKTIGRDSMNNFPRVTVGTVHSVKGGEADHVWIDRTPGTAIIPGDREAINDEIRIAYVAITRARKTVGLLPSLKGRMYSFWM